MIIALVKGWLRIVIGCMTRKGMGRFQGHLEWALSPSGDMAPFFLIGGN